MIALSTDARSNTKVFLQIWINPANITKDDAVSVAGVEYMYWKPNYPMVKEFKAPSVVHGIYAVGDPDSEPLLGHDQVPYGYRERVPIVIVTLDKAGVTGTLLQWKMEHELRRICLEHPVSSQRILERGRNLDEDLGSTKLYVREWIMNYRRETT